LCRAVDSRGQTIDFWLSAARDAAAAKRFFRKALTQPHTVNCSELPPDLDLIAALPQPANTATKPSMELTPPDR
jgi:hypothetical protein